MTWIKVSERWWSEGSDVWQSRQRHSITASARGILSTVESSLAMSGASSPDHEKPRPSWWPAAMTLGHLETKLHAAKVLDSPTEYKQVLLVYAKRLADEGFRAKAEELVRELFGPVYWCVLFTVILR
jgi:protein HIRA/HIR1